MADSEFYGVAGSGQWSQKFTDSGVRSLRLRGRHQSQKFTESGVINLRLWQAAESGIDGCDRQRRQIFTGSGFRLFTDSGVRSLRLWQAVESEVYGSLGQAKYGGGGQRSQQFTGSEVISLRLWQAVGSEIIIQYHETSIAKLSQINKTSIKFNSCVRDKFRR